jgi:hypothetical protein
MNILILNIEPQFISEIITSENLFSDKIFLVNHDQDHDFNFTSPNFTIINSNMVINYQPGLNYPTKEEINIASGYYKKYLYHSLRFKSNLSQIDYEFYNSLTYWLHFFKSNKIDAVLNYTITHGSAIDLALDIANEFNISNFERFNVGGIYYTIYSASSDDFVKNPSIIYKRQYLNNLLTQRNSNLMLLEKSGLVGKSNRYLISTTLTLILKLFGTINTQIIFNYFKYFRSSDNNFLQKAKMLSQSKKFYLQSRNYYKKISVKPDYNERFIYFSLNFEPEAALNGKAYIQNQLYWIEMISNLIPDGTYLYVKEHPHFFNFNNMELYYYLQNIQYYKNYWFYNRLFSMKNVRIIDYNTSSKDLLSYSNITICNIGSIMYEAIENNKPILILEPKYSIVRNLDGVKVFSSIHELKQILESAINSKIDYVEYKGYDNLFNDYFFEINKTRVEVLIDMINGIKN